jgi:putative transposase
VDVAFVKINGERHYLWRAVDHEGEVLESFVTRRRNKRVALKMLRKLMRRYGQPEVLVTDRFPTYKAALRDLGCAELQACGRWLVLSEGIRLRRAGWFRSVSS